MFGRLSIIFGARKEDVQGVMIEVAHHVHREEYVQQVDVEEVVVQSSNVERRRHYDAYPKV